MGFVFMHNTNGRFAEGNIYEVIQDMPEYECCIVKIENDSYRKCDIIYYYQGFKTVKP